VGQNLGAGKPQRAAISAWIIAGLNVLVMASVVSIYMFLARPLVQAMVRGGPEVVEEGVPLIYLLAPAYIFSALGVVMGRSLDGAGDTLPAMWVNLITLWVVQIPVAYLLARGLDMGTSGIWLGIGCSSVLNGITLALWFLRGGWRLKKV
jgi:Na+-driven multidrug efflux pump